ncbi:MAG: hypothetical protein AAF355_04000 [Myxococcota bacterium]
MEDAASNWLAHRSRETKIRRDARGHWYNDGVRIDHPGLVRSFNAWIDLAEDGRYCIKNDINWAYIEVEGLPVFVRSVRFEPPSIRILSSTLGVEESVSIDTLIQDEHGVLYCRVKDGRLIARLDSHAMLQLEDHLDEDDHGVFLRSGEHIVRPKVSQVP